ncbi:unnamed protein product [Pleuronectes platessa]|uniref:Uncharacterized protein n=1 Tax=Pleuronectes platessa TaxID=8262 RepID=A0A9N7VTQ0_PLEPL|nr:unnamed protein product [Pleuronectes platessa]
MRVNIPKDNPNMTCQAVPLQSQSMVSNHPDHDPTSRPDTTPFLSHRPPPPTRTHHEPPPRSWSTARAQCQRDTGSATSTTISPHNSESATLDPQTAIHGAATEALDLRDCPRNPVSSENVQWQQAVVEWQKLGLWAEKVSGSTPRRDNKRQTRIDLSKNPRVSLPCLVPLSKAPHSPNICSPSAVHGRSLLCVSCTRWVKSRD